MVASVVRRHLGESNGGKEEEEEEEEVHPGALTWFVGEDRLTARGGGMRLASGGGALVVRRSIAVLPLRRLSLLGYADGWVRVGT